MSDSLESLLVELGRALDFALTPDLVTSVGRRLRSEPGVRRSAAWERWNVAAVAASLLLGAVLTVATTNMAVAEKLGLPGVLIRVVDELPDVSPRAGTIAPGRLVTLEAASAGAAFELVGVGALGDPDEVYLDDAVPGGAVSFVYYPRPGLPEAEATGVGAILTQFQGRVSSEFITKVAVGGGTRVKPVDVDGAPGYFFTGSGHLVYFTGADGEVYQSEGRLAGNTLLWERGGVTYRLEAELSLNEALRVARSVE